MTQLISCLLHDYIEIACMYRYRVRLSLSGGAVMEGRALDISVDETKREYLIVENDQKQWIELNKLKKLEVLSANPAFKEVNF